MTKILYKYDGAGDFTVDLVADDYVLQANETFTAPEAGILLPVTFDGTTWTGATAEQHQEYLDAQPSGETVAATPSAEMQAINALGLQVATLMADKAADTTGGAK